MTVEQLENGWVRLPFEIGAPPMIFKDALILTEEEYATLTPEEIQARKQARYDNWISIINAPPAEPDPSTVASQEI